MYFRNPDSSCYFSAIASEFLILINCLFILCQNTWDELTGSFSHLFHEFRQNGEHQHFRGKGIDRNR